MHLIGLTGRAGCGKDTVANFLIETHGFVKTAFADPIKDGIKAMFGLSDHDISNRANKEAKIDRFGKSPRELMQLLGTEFGREMVRPDVWLNETERRVRKIMALPAHHHISGVVVSDVRFENEADWIRSMGGIVWIIDRPQSGLSGITGSHKSEQAIPRHITDIVIDNSGSIEQLYQDITDVIQLTEDACKAVCNP